MKIPVQKQTQASVRLHFRCCCCFVVDYVILIMLVVSLLLLLLLLLLPVLLFWRMQIFVVVDCFDVCCVAYECVFC